jgi:murein DD-endopeptidase MepM/ murein hydrolase activator NlpD
LESPSDRLTSTSIPTSAKRWAASAAVGLFRAFRALKRGLQKFAGLIGKALAPIGRLILRGLILPVYGLIVGIRLRINRLALPARGAVLFFITNRYLLHASIALLAIITIIGNFEARQAHAQDIGQHSLLFAMATDQQSEIVEEPVEPTNVVHDANYLAAGTFIGIPNIDFDYTDTATVQPSLTVPGTIAAAPFEIPGTKPQAPRTQIETYVVKDGDTLGSIAQQFGVNVGTILWNNSLTEKQYIRPGDTLTIPPVSGLIIAAKKGDTLSSLASRYNADVNEIASANNLDPNESIAVGKQLIVPGGTPPEIVQTQTQIIASSQHPTTPAVRVPPSAPSSLVILPSSGHESPSASYIGSDGIPRNPITENDAPKPPDASTAAADSPSNRLMWPTSGHSITQYYGLLHTGIDIDGDYSSPMYAAADGVVEQAGWNSGGYGLMIMIDHPQLNMKTRYGHSSKLFVKAGDVVKKGQVIAMIGTTGRSTGTHLHFEVYVNNVRTNPLGYVHP